MKKKNVNLAPAPVTSLINGSTIERDLINTLSTRLRSVEVLVLILSVTFLF